MTKPGKMGLTWPLIINLTIFDVTETPHIAASFSEFITHGGDKRLVGGFLLFYLPFSVISNNFKSGIKS